MGAVKAKRVSSSATAERGCLLIADIAGYTDYVVSSPLEHAEDVLAEVTAAVAERLGAILRVNKLEGDAVFAYALEGGLDGSLLLDAIEDAYTVFRSRLQGISHSTSCGCNACAKLPQLDLKFVAHYGSFVRRRARSGEELTGRDVIVVHRLLKNRVAETLSVHGYALVTEACVDALGLDPAELGMREHAEDYPDVGIVDAFALDLEARWLESDASRREYVGPEDASFEVETLVRAAPPLVWEYLTAPARRALWQGSVVEERSGGRRGPGTTSYCVDGRKTVYEEILDWRPFEYFTERRSFPGGRLVLTTELVPAPEGTSVRTRARPAGRAGRIAWVAARPGVIRGIRRSYERLAALAPLDVPS